MRVGRAAPPHPRASRVVGPPVRVHVHDHSGHSFPVHLSRALAARGHDVVHGYSRQFESPHGRLAVGPDDPQGLQIEGLSAAVPFDKYSPVQRIRYELSYARAWQRFLDSRPADVVLACNVPLFTLASMSRYLSRRRVPWVLWHQDIYSRAMAEEAGRVLPRRLSAVAGEGFRRLERRQVARADATVAIGDAFVDQYRAWGLPTEWVQVQPNWTPVDEVVPGERDNGWAAAHGLPVNGLRLVYAGTLGRKHNPQLLVDLLDAVHALGVEANLTVASEGVAADELAAATSARDDVRVLPFAGAEQFSDMLAGADICVALLEPAAAQFSVPSKILSYLCAGRPAVALVPGANPAAAEVARAGGFTAEPEPAGVRAAAGWIAELARDPQRRKECGAAARAHAEREYDIDRIADDFEALLEDVVAGRRGLWRSAGDAASERAEGTPRGYSRASGEALISPTEGGRA